MRKIHVTRQFFEASGRHGDLIKKQKKPFLDKVNGSMYAKFQVCIVFRCGQKAFLLIFWSEKMFVIYCTSTIKRVLQKDFYGLKLGERLSTKKKDRQHMKDL